MAVCSRAVPGSPSRTAISSRGTTRHANLPPCHCVSHLARSLVHTRKDAWREISRLRDDLVRLGDMTASPPGACFRLLDRFQRTARMPSPPSAGPVRLSADLSPFRYLKPRRLRNRQRLRGLFCWRLNVGIALRALSTGHETFLFQFPGGVRC